jgi:hypothetical protein
MEYPPMPFLNLSLYPRLRALMTDSVRSTKVRPGAQFGYGTVV